jgi:hypothetical protein
VDTTIETRTKIVLAGASQAERLQGNGGDIVANIPELAALSPTSEYTAATLVVKPTDLCYVAFTSGRYNTPRTPGLKAVLTWAIVLASRKELPTSISPRVLPSA